MASVGDLFVSLGFDVDSKALEQFDQGIKNLSGNMLELLGVTGITAYGVNQFVVGAMGGAQTMVSLAQGTRLAALELQNYSNVVHYMNKDISTETAGANIAQLDARLNALKGGYTGDSSLIYALGRIGVNAKDMNLMQILDVMNQKFSSGEIKPTDQLSVLNSMGLAPQFLNALNAKPGQLAYAHGQVDLTKSEFDNLAESSRKINETLLSIYTLLEKALAFLIGHNKTDEPFTKEGFKKGIGQEWNDFIHKDVPDYFKNKGNSLWGFGNSSTTSSTSTVVANKTIGDTFADLEAKNNLPSGTLAAVMYQESRSKAYPMGGDPNALSSKGAVGPFQFLPSTAKDWGLKDSHDLNQSADAAARYLGYLEKKFGNINLALAAYNWGEGRLSKKGISHAPDETKDYVNNIVININSHEKPKDLIHAIKQSYQNTIMQINNPSVV